MGQKWVGFLYFIHPISLLFQLVVLCSAPVRAGSWADAALATTRVLPLCWVQQGNLKWVTSFLTSNTLLKTVWLNSVPYPHWLWGPMCCRSSSVSLPVHTPSCRTHLCVVVDALMLKQCFTAIRSHTNTALAGDRDFPHSSQHFSSIRSQVRPLCTFAALALSCLDWTTVNNKVLYVF